MPTWASTFAGTRTNAVAGWSGGRSPPRRNGAAGERRRDAERENLTRGGRSTCPTRARRAANRTARSMMVVPQAHPGYVLQIRARSTRRGSRNPASEPKRARTLRRAPRRTDGRGRTRTGREGRQRPKRQPGNGRRQTNAPATTARPIVFRARRTAGAPRVGGRQRSSHSPTSAETL
jgi:hypothetical protein